MASITLRWDTAARLTILRSGPRNGQPIYPVTEKQVPAGAPFQNAAPTQPYSAVEPITLLSFDQLTADEQPISRRSPLR